MIHKKNLITTKQQEKLKQKLTELFQSTKPVYTMQQIANNIRKIEEFKNLTNVQIYNCRMKFELKRPEHLGMSGHNYDHNKGDICKACGKIHLSIKQIHGLNKKGGMKGHNWDHNKGDVCKLCGKIHHKSGPNGKSGPHGHTWDYGDGTVCSKCGKIHTRLTDPIKYAQFVERAHKKAKKFYNTPKGIQLQRERRLHQILPNKDTKIEIILQKELDKRNIQYIKHKNFKLSNGSYHRTDLFLKPNICIECDGCRTHACLIHHPNGWTNGLKKENYVKHGIKTREHDLFLTKEMQQQNQIVLRFWEHDINNRLDWCIEQILEKLIL